MQGTHAPEKRALGLEAEGHLPLEGTARDRDRRGGGAITSGKLQGRVLGAPSMLRRIEQRREAYPPVEVGAGHAEVAGDLGGGFAGFDWSLGVADLAVGALGSAAAVFAGGVALGDGVADVDLQTPNPWQRCRWPRAVSAHVDESRVVTLECECHGTSGSVL